MKKGYIIFSKLINIIKESEKMDYENAKNTLLILISP